MPGRITENSKRMSLRIRPEDKALLVRAAAIQQTTLTDFMVRHTVQAARELIDQAERVRLTPRDSQRVLELLENPPEPDTKLMKAAQNLPNRS